MHLNQNLGTNTIAKEMGLSRISRIYLWVKLYQEKGETAFDDETRGRSKGHGKGRPKTKFSSLEEELKFLRMENEFLKKLKALQGK